MYRGLTLESRPFGFPLAFRLTVEQWENYLSANISTNDSTYLSNSTHLLSYGKKYELSVAPEGNKMVSNKEADEIWNNYPLQRSQTVITLNNLQFYVSILPNGIYITAGPDMSGLVAVLLIRFRYVSIHSDSSELHASNIGAPRNYKRSMAIK